MFAYVSCGVYLGSPRSEPHRSPSAMEVAMNITAIWRYPVKSMAGEQLQRVRIGPLGIEGDRLVHVEGART